MKYKFMLLVLLFGGVSGASWASDRLVKFDFGLGVTFGGDEIAYAEFTDGSSDKIKAGEFLHFYGGVLFDFPESPFSTRLAFGYHVDDITAENGRIKFDRKPVEIVPFYNINENNRIGVGLSYHLDPTLTSDVFSDVTFDDALGFLVEYGYGFSSGKVWLGLRYLNIDYDPSAIGGTPVTAKSIDGSHFGIYVHTAL